MSLFGILTERLILWVGLFVVVCLYIAVLSQLSKLWKILGASLIVVAGVLSFIPFDSDKWVVHEFQGQVQEVDERSGMYVINLDEGSEALIIDDYEPEVDDVLELQCKHERELVYYCDVSARL